MRGPRYVSVGLGVFVVKSRASAMSVLEGKERGCSRKGGGRVHGTV